MFEGCLGMLGDPVDAKNGQDPANALDEVTIATRAHKLFVVIVACGLVATFAWAHFTQIDIVTRGSGRVVPSLQNQFVQHLEGGIIQEILVREGQYVKKGDILLTIRDPFSRAEYEKAQKLLLSRQAELVRLEAESQNLPVLEFPQDVVVAVPDVVADERDLFNSRQQSLEQQHLILEDQRRRKLLEKQERENRLESVQVEYNLAEERVKILSNLFDSGAVSRSELLENKSRLQQIETKISDLTHQIPQIEAELSEIARRKSELVLQFRSDAEAEKINTLRAIDELNQTLTAMSDRNLRSEVRAPIDGKVHRLFQTTIGGVVRSGQNLVQLVPTDAPISIDISLSPKDRAKVWIGLPAVVQLSAYDYSLHAGLEAKVVHISTDILHREEEEPYYWVKLEANTSSFGEDKPILAGMAAEVDIIIGKRTILDFLLTPIRAVQENALREY